LNPNQLSQTANSLMKMGKSMSTIRKSSMV
jgi:hypothetical protein